MKQTHLSRVFGDIHLPQFLIACYMLALLLETVLVSSFRPIKYLDEATAVLMGIIFLADCIYTRRVHWDELLIIALTACMVALGLAGNLKYDLVHTKYYWALDAFNMFKFIVTSLGAVRLFSRTKNNEYIIQYLALFSEIVIIVSTICLIINCFTDINMSTDVRYGFRTYNFVFKRVGDYYEACLYFLMIFFADLYVEKRRITWWFIVLTILNMVSTLRSRAFAYAALFILFYIAFVVFKVKKVKLRYTVPILLIAAITFAGQFIYYFSGDKARNVLVRYGIHTMIAYFPIGSGFATFGTSVAKDHYSKLFFRYGFWRYFGTSMSHSNYLLDTYWPAIMAELGFFGAIVMLIVILLLFKRNVLKCNNPYSRICIYGCWIPLLISSTVSSSFMAGTKAMVMSSLVGILAPIAVESSDTIKNKHISIKRVTRVTNMTGIKKLIIFPILILLSVFFIGLRYKQEIKQRLFPELVEKTASIITETDTMIYDGSGEFNPFTESLILKNARLSDENFRNKSVKIIRKIIGNRYSTLTDKEIEAVTGEQVVNGRTKSEILRDSQKGEAVDLSVFGDSMTTDEREEILSTSKALNQTFDLSGESLRDVLSVIVSTGATGNFRDRFIYYYYWLTPDNRLRGRRRLRLEGYHLPAMLLPENVPMITRDMLVFDAVSSQDLKNKYTDFANYFGIVSHNGFRENENKDMIVEQIWDQLHSQRVNLKFIHDTWYGLRVNRQIDVRVAGPEITLKENAVYIRKDSDFDPYSYIESVVFEDGKNALRFLEIDNQVRTDIPGYYTVTYSCGEDSIIQLYVCVTT